MKAAVLYFRYPLYPAGSYFQEFINKLADSLDAIYLIASKYPNGPFKKPNNIRFFWVPFINIRFAEDFFYMLSTLFTAIFSSDLHKVDVVDTIGPRGLLAGWYLKKVHGIPLVCTIEMLNERGPTLNNLYYEIVRLLMTKAPVDKFISWSNYYWENHLKKWGISDERVANISGGINTEVYNPTVDGHYVKIKFKDERPLLVFAKPLDSTNTRSAKILVEAAALLKPKIPVKLLIGSGEGKKEICNLARGLGIEDSIEFMPITPFPEIPNYIAAADLIVLPFTYAATTSRSLLEAMAMGKAIVTTKVGEIPKIVENGREALLVNPTTQDVSDAIELLITDRALAATLGRNAAALVTKKYSLSITIDETMKLFTFLRNPRGNLTD